jgi:hypothetical protein
MSYGAADALPLPGASTAAMKVLREQRQPHQLTLTLEAPGGSTQKLLVHSNDSKAHISADGAMIRDSSLIVKFSGASGYQQQTVTLRW